MKLAKTLRLVYMLPVSGLGVLWPFSTALAQTGRYHDWNMMPGMMGHWGFGWYGGIFTIAFWIVILVGLIFLVKWLIQSTGRDRTGDGKSDRALEILRERYAQGEIDKDEFAARKNDLTG